MKPPHSKWTSAKSFLILGGWAYSVRDFILGEELSVALLLMVTGAPDFRIICQQSLDLN